MLGYIPVRRLSDGPHWGTRKGGNHLTGAAPPGAAVGRSQAVRYLVDTHGLARSVLKRILIQRLLCCLSGPSTQKNHSGPWAAAVHDCSSALSCQGWMEGPIMGTCL